MPRGTVVPLLPDVPGGEEVRPKGEPLGRLVELFIAHRFPQLRPSTRASYRQTFALAESLVSKKFPAVHQIGAWVTYLRAEYPPPPGCSDSWTVHLHWHNLAALYEWGKEWGYVSGVNPAAVLKLPKPQPRARAIVDIADLWPHLLDACHDLRERTLLTAARDFGARRGELLGLKPCDLVTFGEPWRMRFERQRPKPNSYETTPLKTKRANRALPVTPELRTMLADLLALGPPVVMVGRGGQRAVESPFLFPYRTHDLDDLRKRLGAVAPAAFGPGDFLHALRHTLAFEMDRAGESLENIGKQFGHSTSRSTDQTYVNMLARPVDAAPVRRLLAARRHGVTTWGAPPGATGPPVAAEASGTAGVRAPAVPKERSTKFNPPGRQEATCNTPSRKAKSSARELVEKVLGPAPRRQRTLPGMAVQPVVRRPKRR